MNRKYIIFFLLGISMTACISLDRYPDDKLSSGTFWKSTQQADAAVAGLYTRMRNQSFAFGLQFSLDCLGNVAMGYDQEGIATNSRGTYTASDSWVAGKWRQLYQCVAGTNYFLQNIGKVEMDENLRKEYIAEARFLRAFFYFELTKFYGAVPLYDETVVVEESYNDMKKGRTPIDEIYEFILEDIDYAAEYLPDTRPAEFTGRVCSSAALALKGKVLLYAKEYSQAALAFEEVVNSGRHELYPDYAKLFTPEGDSSSEMIFAIQNIGGVEKNAGMPMAKFMGTRSTKGSGWNNVMMSSDFASTYEWLDGKPFNWDEVFPGFTTDKNVKKTVFKAELTLDGKAVQKYPAEVDKLKEVWTKRDPRLNATAILPYTEYKGWVNNAPKLCTYVVANGVTITNGFVQGNNNWMAYFFRKFVPEYDMGGDANSRDHTPINFPLIRYADVLLMLAECYNEVGRLNEAVDLVNKVRARAGMPGLNSGPSWLAVSDKEEMSRRIRRERGWELAGEGLSFDDYKRWGILETLNGPVQDLLGETPYTRKVTPRDYLWPIPQVECDLNEKLKNDQNIGW